VKKINYAELVGLRGIRPIMRKIMRAHKRVIPLSLIVHHSPRSWQRVAHPSDSERC